MNNHSLARRACTSTTSSKQLTLPDQTPNQPLSKAETAAASFDRRADSFTAAWTLGFLVLIASTFQLWLGGSDFPQIPLLPSLVGAPLISDWIALGCLFLTVSFLLVNASRQFILRQENLSPGKHRIAAAICAVSILCLFLLNQHRLQPWAWQFFLYAVLLTLARRSDELITAARWLTASIYFFSAVSKFDYQFIYGLGGTMAQTLAELAGVEASGWISFIAALMPVFELLVAFLLIVRRTSKTGVLLAAIFHAALIVTLGPWGLDHHLGVLIWNLFFFLIATILFWPTVAEHDESATVRQNALLFAGTIAMVLYPVLPHCDHWIAWGLYSPNNSRSELEYVRQSDDGEAVFQRIDLSKISLEQLNAPLYPAARFQLGVAIAIQEKEKENWGNRSRIVIKSKSNRFTGQRESTVFRTSQEWNKNNRRFFFNWTPRQK